MPFKLFLEYLRLHATRLLWVLVALVAGLILLSQLPTPVVGTLFFLALVAWAAGEFAYFLWDTSRLRRWERVKSHVAHGLCPGCGYDLRGTRERCPECGADAVAPRLALALAEQDYDDPEWRERADAAARAAGCPVDAFVFVLHALHYAQQLREADESRLAPGAGRTPDGEEAPPASAARVTRHVTGRDVCRAIAAIAPAYFGGRAEAFETLSAWGIRRGDDVRRVVAASVDAGLLQASEEDTPASFEGAFELERDLSSAGTS